MVQAMNTAIIESAQSYEQERGKPIPSKNHAIVQVNLGIELAKDRDYRVMSELSWNSTVVRSRPTCRFIRVARWISVMTTSA